MRTRLAFLRRYGGKLSYELKLHTAELAQMLGYKDLSIDLCCLHFKNTSASVWSPNSSRMLKTKIFRKQCSVLCDLCHKEC